MSGAVKLSCYAVLERGGGRGRARDREKERKNEIAEDELSKPLSHKDRAKLEQNRVK